MIKAVFNFNSSVQKNMQSDSKHVLKIWMIPILVQFHPLQRNLLQIRYIAHFKKYCKGYYIKMINNSFIKILTKPIHMVISLKIIPKVSAHENLQFQTLVYLFFSNAALPKQPTASHRYNKIYNYSNHYTNNNVQFDILPKHGSCQIPACCSK